jgi:hypothetical protein
MLVAVRDFELLGQASLVFYTTVQLQFLNFQRHLVDLALSKI